MRAFLLLFLLFPVLELYVFFKVSTAIGFFPALLLIIAGSLFGVLVVRVAGLATALSARESLNRGELPAQQMLHGTLECRVCFCAVRKVKKFRQGALVITGCALM